MILLRFVTSDPKKGLKQLPNEIQQLLAHEGLEVGVYLWINVTIHFVNAKQHGDTAWINGDRFTTYYGTSVNINENGNFPQFAAQKAKGFENWWCKILK